MTFPREIKSYMGEPRTDPLLRCIRVPFRPYLLPKGRTGVGRGFLQVLLQNKVSLSLATWLLRVPTYSHPRGRRKRQAPVSLIKLLIEWHSLDILSTEKKWVVLVLNLEFSFLTASNRKRNS